ncbi:MAG: hypothetical protein RIR79_794 [Pseudomonadota bacterium]|jgi:peptidoglycan/xylan/chitin deacetylase (PgdA/CDA1 family)
MRHANSVAITCIATIFVATSAGAACDSGVKPIYLTFDTGHMGVAPLIADVLKRHHVRVTFFAAHERTQVGDGSMGTYWANWWKDRAAEGHEFASHTYNHVYWRGEKHWNTTLSTTYCEELKHASQRLQEMTGKAPLPLFRAPGGRTSPQLLATAKTCGYTHVGWSPAGFLGDELPSEKYSNKALLDKALRDIRAGDILVAHLGIWSRKDPWAPTVLEPLITGLQAKGFCFKTLREHPELGRVAP